MIHVLPIPEENEIQAVLAKLQDLVDLELPSYEIEVSAVYASRVEVIGMDDLDALETIEDF